MIRTPTIEILPFWQWRRIKQGMEKPARQTTESIRKLKGQRPIVALTAYDTAAARLVDESGVDVILVGDSVGTTLLGFDSTVPVTLEAMIHHTAAVARGNQAALLVADVPFGYGRHDPQQLIRAAVRLMQEGGGCAVKLETVAADSEVVAGMVAAGIPVMGHIGLLPQRIHQLGGYRKFGKRPGEAAALLEDATALERAGCFALVAEMVDGGVARELAAKVSIPIIGIGSGPDCDGQILVYHDILGLTPGKVPSFVKVYDDVAARIRSAVSGYVDDVRSRRFPS